MATTIIRGEDWLLKAANIKDKNGAEVYDGIFLTGYNLLF